MTAAVPIRKNYDFDPREFLATIGEGRRVVRFAKKQAIPEISQETLAEMIGTTRSRVSFFMNRFRKLGFVNYDASGLQVHSSLLNIVLHD